MAVDRAVASALRLGNTDVDSCRARGRQRTAGCCTSCQIAETRAQMPYMPVREVQVGKGDRVARICSGCGSSTATALTARTLAGEQRCLRGARLGAMHICFGGVDASVGWGWLGTVAAVGSNVRHVNRSHRSPLLSRTRLS